jgi:uncharacterized protein (TIGR02246 family)
MRVRSAALVVSSVLLMAVTIAPLARAGETDVVQQAQDRAAIEALMWRYVRALDSLDADGYAAVYTPDGKFSSGANVVQGSAALKTMVADLKKNRAAREAAGEPSAPMYHVITNDSIEFLDRDHARYDSYWMTVFAAAGEGQTPRVAAVGRGVDMLVRVGDRWLIQSRDVRPQ